MRLTDPYLDDMDLEDDSENEPLVLFILLLYIYLAVKLIEEYILCKVVYVFIHICLN